MNNQNAVRTEHEIVRTGVGFYDFTLEVLEVSGKDAKNFLDYIFVNDVGKMKKGEALYTTMLNEEGNVLDDLILFCREVDKFWITTGFIDQLKKWTKEKVQNREVFFKDITDEKAIYAVQGPKSKDLLNDLLKDSINELKTFEFINTKIDDIEVMVSRTGFTGELGYELHFNPKHMGQIADKIKEKGKPYEIEELVTDVTLKSLPGEKGYITDADFIDATPIELGLGWTVNCEKEFIGKEKVCMQKELGPDRNLLGFMLDNKEAKIEKEDKIKLDGQEVGKVTTVNYSYTFEKTIGYALVDSKAKKGDMITIITKDGDVEARLEERVFYDPHGEKIKGESLTEIDKRIFN